ncbi:hypothetical protein NMG60_11005438 [Bertholletia excelsa]
MKMDTNLSSPDHEDEEEEYIDMEVRSSDSFCYSISSSPPQTREFEFQMSSGPTTSPADELFCNGKLLPLHLPLRLETVQKLLQSSNSTTFRNTKEASYEEEEKEEEESYTIPSVTICPTPSFKTSIPVQSCRGNSDKHFVEWYTELRGFLADNLKKPLSKKLKLIKQSLLVQKFKASRAYLKSPFSNPACSEPGHDSKVAFVIKSTEKEMVEEDLSNGYHRKSFSGAIRQLSATESSSSLSSSSSGAFSLSSSFSINSGEGFNESQNLILNRSSSANRKIEDCSVEEAIAHCRQSQKLLSSSKKNTSSQVGLCSLSASRTSVSEDKER